MKNIVVSFVLIILFFTACQSSKPPKDAKIVELGSKQTGGDKQVQLANFTLQLPDGWEKEAPSNTMRIAQFRLKNNPEYQVVVSYFGDMDNKVDDNIARWKNQFTKIDNYTELETAIKGITAVKILGTFKKKPFPMAQDFVEEEGFGALAAIVPSNEGPYFLKLTAPAGVINEQVANFIEMLNSYSVK